MFADEIRLFDLPAGDADAVPVIFAFPNTYEIGITSLGYQVVWRLLASCPGVEVARLFTDIHETLPARPELFGFSFSWELDYDNVLALLEKQRIPVWAAEREEEHPLVFGGGPVFTANPEPFALFFDFFLLGDGEELIAEVIAAYQQVRTASRRQKLLRLAQIPGVYVPAFYEGDYREGEARIEPVVEGIPATLERRTFRGGQLSHSAVVTERCAWPGIFMVEVARSCPEMCRFCLASYLTLPFRSANVETGLLPAIEKGLQVTNRLGLLGASVTQHPQFAQIIDYLARPEHADVRLSVSSVRTNTLSPQFCRTLAARGSQSVTIAIESGSERLRRIVNKKLSNDEIFSAAATASAAGLQGLKLYGMCGVPGEIQSDLDATAELLVRLKKQNPRLRLSFGCSTFVPKAHTPFQRYGVDPKAEKKLQSLQKALRPQGIDFRPESYNWSVIQALLSRGDRRVAQVLERTRHYGSTLGSFRRAFKDFKGQLPPLDYYVHAQWPDGATLPWQHLRTGLSESLLDRHLDQARSEMPVLTGGAAS
ncbi:B12-binding domain-containing radical SAM protein [Gloeobacter kilaueensis]|uniref:Radical SAM domain-containing protein n=1 Tax=Gloeobacter kilaueensis (strain ATCC BAA-2537 / CCAP 1431/1 / ULC 316 / JS1) TaxID=1183438 RepID=U5QC97_GLOK1|nr:radical SAM protein [Gloeobacter kilaueensis]AGY56486.1 radical SAM domain-containing protein [Gloeobacter kilaueensis JS1]